MAPKDLGVEMKSDLEVVDVAEPPVRDAGIIVEDVPELMSKLKDAGAVWTLPQIILLFIVLDLLLFLFCWC